MDHEDARGSALAALAGLLDRSIAQIAEAAADGRTYDRRRIVMLSGIWDNSAVPLVGAVVATTPEEREERALAVLAALVTRGPGQRAWVLEQLGEGWAGRLPRGRRPVLYRDYAGRVQPVPLGFTPPAFAELAADYDLAGARVGCLWAERAGGEAASGTLELVVGRRYSAVGATGEPRLVVEFEGLSGLAFDRAEGPGAVLEHGADGVTVRLGRGGVVRAAGAVVLVQDVHWHESAAGRRADARTEPLDPDRPRPVAAGAGTGTELGLVAGRVAQALRWTMLEIRSVRYAAEVGRVPVLGYCRMLAGAGAALLAAAGREDELRRAFAEWGSRRPAAAAEEPAGAGREVRFAMWTAAERSRREGAVVNVAVAPPEGGGPWRMTAYEHPEPALFRLELAGGRLTVQAEG